MELFRIKKDIPFMSYGRITTAISLLTFILAVFFLATKGLNYGVDFTGGTVMEVHYPQTANIDSIRKAVDSIGFLWVSCEISQTGDVGSSPTTGTKIQVGLVSIW